MRSCCFSRGEERYLIPERAKFSISILQLRSLLCRARQTTKPSTVPAEIDRLAAENESLRDRLLRALADAENTRRRTEDRHEDARKFSIADFAREMLIVVDNLQRAVAVAESNEAASNQTLLEGVQTTLRLFKQTLERFSVRRIEALGRRFDPHLHEAVMAVDDRSQPPNTVVRVLDEGYTIDNRLLRPARVVVTTSQNQKPRPADENELGSEWGLYCSRGTDYSSYCCIVGKGAQGSAL
jgi:molecular chaperone GrpE